MPAPRPRTLQSAVNSIVCVDDDRSPTSLYRLFHPPSSPSSSSSSSYHVGSSLKFLSERCRTATRRCEECLSRQRCLTSGELSTAAAAAAAAGIRRITFNHPVVLIATLPSCGIQVISVLPFTGIAAHCGHSDDIYRQVCSLLAS